jgi:hypothetical protein
VVPPVLSDVLPSLEPLLAEPPEAELLEPALPDVEPPRTELAELFPPVVAPEPPEAMLPEDPPSEDPPIVVPELAEPMPLELLLAPGAERPVLVADDDPLD